jgi:hypothetical protein
MHHVRRVNALAEPITHTSRWAVFLPISLYTRTITMSIPYATEKQVAISAVRRACVLTDSVFNKLVKNETMTKEDKSPVTGERYLNVLLRFLG